MELCLGDLNKKCLLIYFDEIIIFPTFKKHLDGIDQVLR